MGFPIGPAGGAIGLLAALATEAALVSLDRPDTRSSTMLADHVLVSRTLVEPGDHTVRVGVQGLGSSAEREIPVSLALGEIAVLVVTDPR